MFGGRRTLCRSNWTELFAYCRVPGARSLVVCVSWILLRTTEYQLVERMCGGRVQDASDDQYCPNSRAKAAVDLRAGSLLEVGRVETWAASKQEDEDMHGWRSVF